MATIAVMLPAPYHTACIMEPSIKPQHYACTQRAAVTHDFVPQPTLGGEMTTCPDFNCAVEIHFSVSARGAPTQYSLATGVFVALTTSSFQVGFLCVCAGMRKVVQLMMPAHTSPAAVTGKAATAAQPLQGPVQIQSLPSAGSHALQAAFAGAMPMQAHSLAFLA